MGKCKTINKVGTNSQKGASPFPSLQEGEEGKVVQEPMEEITSGEEVLPQPPFIFGRTSQLPSERSVSSEH